MKETTFERDQFIAAPIELVFARYADAANLDQITPPWLRFSVLSETPIDMREGTIIEHRLWLHGIPIRWTTVVDHWDFPHGFVDVQVRGPYALWRHTHIFESVEGGTIARDRVCYRVGFGLLGTLVHHLIVRRDVERIFDYRRDAILQLLTGEDIGLSPGEKQRSPIHWAIAAGIGVAAVGLGWAVWGRRSDRAT